MVHKFYVHCSSSSGMTSIVKSLEASITKVA